MKRLLLLAFCLLLAVSTAAAQDSLAPSDYIPNSTEFYAEIDLSEDALRLFGDMLEWFVPLYLPPTVPRPEFEDIRTLPLANFFPDALPEDVSLSDILPWSGDHLGAAELGYAIGGYMLIIPVRDPAGAQAFAEQIASGEPEASSVATFYRLPDAAGSDLSLGTVSTSMTLALAPEVMLIGSSANVHRALQTVLSLSDHANFTRVTAELPTAPLRFYINGNALTSAIRLSDDQITPLMGVGLDAALRLHPAQTDAEDALLDSSGLDGFAAALFADGDRIYLQAALAVNTDYDDESGDPTTRLWNYVPSESIAVLSAHDLTVPASAIIMLSQMNRYISSTFDTVVNSIQNPGSPIPQPEIPTAEHLLMLGRSALDTVFAAAGTEMNEFYEMVGGEYAVAAFPAIGGEGMRYALWIDTPDSGRLLEFLETGATSFAELSGLPAPQRQDAAGHPAFVAQLTPAQDIGVIALDETTVVITTIDDALNVVIGVVEGTIAPLPTALIQPVEAAGDIKVYASPQGLISLGMLPPMPLSLVGATFETRADGVFVLTVMAQPEG